ncbi:MAG: AMP-binding protein [Polyangiales bacterium]
MRLFDHVADPSAVALDDGTRSRSFAELESRLPRLVSVLRKLGLEAGDHAALYLHNEVAFAELVLAAIAAGVWLTPINWHLAEEEIAYVLDDSGAKLLVVGDGTRDRIPSGNRARVLDVVELEALVRSEPEGELDGGAVPGATMIYTSGTSGRPKGVKRRKAPTLEAAIASHRAGGKAFGLDGSGPHLLTGPMYHAAPLLFAIYDLLNGAPLHLMPRWDERAALQAIAAHRIRHAHFVPTMFVRLLRLPEEERRAADVSSLALVLHGAAPIALDVKRAMIAWWGPVLTEYWGATEGGIYTLVSSTEWLERPGTVGRGVPTFEVFAIDEAGAKLPPNEIGTLCCRHRQFPDAFEYHRDPEKTARSFPVPGVFTVGDLGHVDEDGYVYLSDRRSNLILSGGVNIYPAEVERVLSAHPAVADVAVFGMPDAEWGETVMAVVELVPEHQASAALEAELVAFARGSLAGFKVPRRIAFEERLPRTTAGKLYVRELRDRYRKEAS